MSDDPLRVMTRRDLLRGVGAVGAAAVGAQGALVGEAAGTAPAGDPARTAPGAQVTAGREVLEHLTAAEADTLEAMAARLIPSDAQRPGAKEARAAHYIDRALGGALAGSRQAYAAGLAALDRLARASRNAAFHELPAADQDALLLEVERGTARDFAGAAVFFEMVRTHTIQGTFCDPYYGGNANFVGWDLIGYPGVRTSVTEDDQRMSQPPTRVHRSAYDSGMFEKASASAGPHGGSGHGD